jgi:transposase
MRNQLTDDDVLQFVLAGCNVEEVATYAGIGKTVAEAWMRRVRRLFTYHHPAGVLDAKPSPTP